MPLFAHLSAVLHAGIRIIIDDEEEEKNVIITLVDIELAETRLAAGEQAYEFQTANTSLRLLGPACGFGPDYLRRLKQEGLYAESLDEAREMAGGRGLTVTGIWFVKRL